MERTAADIELEIGIFNAPHRNGPIDAGGGRPQELERLDMPADRRTDGASDDLRVGRAEAIRQINFLRVEIGVHFPGAYYLPARMAARLGKPKETIGVFESSLEFVQVLRAKREVGRDRISTNPNDFGMMVPSPDFGLQFRGLRELEQTE